MIKPLELTDKQKEQLLEMCKELFPEYKEIYYGVNSYNDDFDGFIYFAKDKLPCEDIVGIHWFEFTTKVLAAKLFSKKYNSKEDDFEFCVTDDVTTFVEDCFIYDKHPVDYLYKEFIQIFKK